MKKTQTWYQSALEMTLEMDKCYMTSIDPEKWPWEPKGEKGQDGFPEEPTISEGLRMR